MKKTGIYCFLNKTNGKCYIGQSIELKLSKARKGVPLAEERRKQNLLHLAELNHKRKLLSNERTR